MSPNDVKEALVKKGFDISGYSNPMASVYRILTRLKESDEIAAETEGFNVYYRCKRKSRYRLRSARLRASAGGSKLVPPSESSAQQQPG